MQFIKKLVIHGFKSFAYKTEIELKEGVIGIVGPNGCGKSNIVDSLKWALGEKNVHSLRGDNVRDIIFAGTEEHKPLGMAEVEIVFNNSDLTLPVKYNEVSVKRRVFGSGETEYFINKNSVRLKDIYDLFADTGVGKGAYSFMEQGKIDMILSNKPEERRAIFEEAAGISKFKIRKKETLSRLESTNHNLEQINVLLKELEKEKESLKAQWEKAKIFREKQEQLKSREIELYGNRYRAAHVRMQELERKINELNDRKVQLRTENSSLNTEIEKINQQILEFNQTKNQFEKEKVQYQGYIRNNSDKIELYEKSLEKNQKDIDNKKEQSGNLVRENQAGQERIQVLESDLVKFTAQKEECDVKYNKILEEISLLEEKKLVNARHKENFKIEIENNRVRIEELKIELRKVTDEFVMEIDKKKREVEGQQDNQASLKNDILEMIRKVEDGLNQLLQNHSPEQVTALLNGLQDLKALLNDLTIHQDEFKNLIFDENGSYAKKEKIDRTINSLMEQLIADQNKISLLETDNEEITKNISTLMQKRSELEAVRGDLKHSVSDIHKEVTGLKDLLQKNNAYLNSFNSEIRELETESRQLSENVSRLKLEIEDHGRKCEEIDRQILRFEEDMHQQNQNMMKRKDKIGELMNKLDSLEDSIEKQKEKRLDAEAEVKEYERYLYHEFDVKIQDAIQGLNENIDEKALSEEIDNIKFQIKELGHVNQLAEELYEDVNKRYHFHIEQKEDLLKAQNDLMQIIEEVNKESVKLFMETFDKVRENFHQIFRRIFGGGKADLILVDPENILETGIEINAQPPGKKINSYAWLSGGERTLLAIGLLFAIFLVKPSPFCVLDEIDAALDEQNNIKFINIMKEFSKNTQFLIVSHNKQTIANTDYLYGVTMEEKGISKIISLELRKEKIDEFIK
ncbi:MAG: AAA family ATPase [bacterium]|nr:AAA family ATPase [bacterium]